MPFVKCGMGYECASRVAKYSIGHVADVGVQGEADFKTYIDQLMGDPGDMERDRKPRDACAPAPVTAPESSKSRGPTLEPTLLVTAAPRHPRTRGAAAIVRVWCDRCERERCQVCQCAGYGSRHPCRPCGCAITER